LQIDLQLTQFEGGKISLKDPPSAVGGLDRLMWVGLVVFCLWGGAWKIFCLYILKAHGLRSMGLFIFYIN